MGILVLGESLWKPRAGRHPSRAGQGRGVEEGDRGLVAGNGGREIGNGHRSGVTGAHGDVPTQIAVRW